VLGSSGQDLPTSLILHKERYTLHAESQGIIENIRTDWRMPDGWTHAEAAHARRAIQCVALGFYYYLDPRPPEKWIDARADWAAYARSVIEQRIKGLDTELGVRNHEIGLGEKANPTWLAWHQIGPTFRGKRRVKWVHDERVRAAVAWAKKERGIVWSQFRAFGERTGLPFFAPRDSHGRTIMDVPGGPVVASVAACSVDLNLQDRWHKNLIVAPMSSSQSHEQLLARTHRHGQKEPEVHATYWLGTEEDHKALAKAIVNDGELAYVTQDDQRKLRIAEWV
jgi:hypothetical protein